MCMRGGICTIARLPTLDSVLYQSVTRQRVGEGESGEMDFLVGAVKALDARLDGSSSQGDEDDSSDAYMRQMAR
jgi:hypothetical protein